MKLKYKISLLASILIITLLSSYLIIDTRRSIDEKTDSMARHTKAIAKMIATLRISELINDIPPNEKLLKEFLELAIGMDSSIAYVAITDSNGRLISGKLNTKWFLIEVPYNETMILQSMLGMKDPHRNLKPVTIEIDRNGVYSGNVKIAFSLIPLKKEVAAAKNINLIIGISFLILGIGGSFYISKRLTVNLGKVASTMKMVEEGDLDQKVSVKTKDEIGDMAHTFNMMLEGLRERERIKDIFSRYVSKQVAERIFKERDAIKLEGERRRVTILFADIRGFTTISEKMLPEEVVSMLNEYFSSIIDIIFRYGGIIDKFIGDAIMVIYNAPLTQDAHELRAILSGIAIQKIIYEINEKRKTEGKIPVEMGIGINTGDAIAGSIGSEKRMEYTVVGSEVNLAQRIVSKSGKGQILISESTYDPVKDFVKVSALESITVKGVENPVAVYSVLDASYDAIKLNNMI
jgi:class 3 adenylate cyclase